MADLILILLICGERGVKKTTEEGTFLCPRCQQRTPCKKKELWKYFHFYYVPLCPTEKVVEYVKCKRCNSLFGLALIESQDYQAKEKKGITKEENKKQAASEKVAPNKVVPVEVKLESRDNQAKEKEAIMKEENNKQAAPRKDAPNQVVPVQVKPEVIPPNRKVPQLHVILDKAPTAPVVAKKQYIYQESDKEWASDKPEQWISATRSKDDPHEPGMKLHDDKKDRKIYKLKHHQKHEHKHKEKNEEIRNLKSNGSQSEKVSKEDGQDVSEADGRTSGKASNIYQAFSRPHY